MTNQDQSRKDVIAFLDRCLQKNIPFYAYRKIDSNQIQMGIQTDGDLLSYQHLSVLKGKDGFVFAPFDLEGRHGSMFIRRDISLNSSEITNKSVNLLESVEEVNIQQEIGETVHESTREEYSDQISKMLGDLKQQKLDKAILSRIHVLDGYGRKDAANSFLNLCKTYQSAFVFMVAIPTVGLWIGASPETLISANGKTMETVALAGTQKLEDRKVADVVWERKEIEEQAYVSDYIEILLDRHRINSYKKNGPVTVQAGNVVHLKTCYQIPANLNFNQLSDLIHDLHPTPAVCGLPKEKAMNLIREVENHDREYYTGYLGPVEANGSLSLFVNLRSMKVLENQMALYVGGGITADSNPQKEWEETCLKAQTLLNVIC